MKLEVLRCRPPAGDDKRPAVLFVHGSYCGAWIWAERFMPYFARQGYPCHAVSLRGHGGSDGELSEAGLGDYVEDVAAAADRLGAPPILVGHSMGGLVVQRYLARHPSAAAVLLSSVPPSGLTCSAVHMTMFAPDILWQLGLLQTLGPQAVSLEVARRAFLSDHTSTAAVHQLMHRMQKESPRIGAELLLPWQPGLPPNGGWPPVLVMGGDADAFLPTAAFCETASWFGADLEILPGAPHGLMVDEAWWQTAADRIIGWLDVKIGTTRAAPTAPR